MKNPGPFGKAFAIAAVFFVLNIVIVAGLGNFEGLSDYETGNLTGQTMAPHLLAAILTGVIAKFALKKNHKWLTILGVYVPTCAVFLGLHITGAS